MLELLTDPASWIALLSLAALEIVLGLDNVVFIAILTSRLPAEERKLAYRLGLGGALVTRIGLLLSLSWVMSLTTDLFVVFGEGISGRDLTLLVGGLFLIAKATHEIYAKVEGVDADERVGKAAGLVVVVLQIAVLDIVFSLDSVITAVGMVKDQRVMVAAIVIAMAVMVVFAPSIGEFVNRHPSMKILALSFLILIGVLLTAEALDQHVNKGYVYSAMGFSLVVELLNMRFRRKHVAPSARGPAVELTARSDGR